MTKKVSAQKLAKETGLYILIIIILIWTLLPLVWLFLSSIFPYKELISNRLGHWIPSHATFKHYLSFFNPEEKISSRFLAAMRNSLIVASVTTAVCLFFGSLAAYAVVRIKFRFKKTMVLSLMFIRMLPTITLIIPFFIIVNLIDTQLINLFGANVHLFDSRSLLIILYTSFTLGFVIWIMRGFYLTMPEELEDAARIDGLTRLQTVFKIVMPLSSNGLIATGVLAFLLAWDEFILALIFTRTENAVTLPLFIAELGSQYIHDFTQISAAGVIACLPPFLLVLIFQRFIVSGLTMGSVKG
ncbi:MAG: carbohydrate ABC transporter permease [Spirochaetales bacterium]|nr:carbohydrate ABC transporter permease [Spirochaetales bacterium]